jgi:hypothetical protein
MIFSSLFCIYFTVLLPLFSFLSPFFFFLLHFPLFLLFHIFSPKWHRLIFLPGGGGVSPGFINTLWSLARGYWNPSEQSAERIGQSIVTFPNELDNPQTSHRHFQRVYIGKQRISFLAVPPKNLKGRQPLYYFYGCTSTDYYIYKKPGFSNRYTERNRVPLWIICLFFSSTSNDMTNNYFSPKNVIFEKSCLVLKEA